jgi:hypothetical protein
MILNLINSVYTNKTKIGIKCGSCWYGNYGIIGLEIGEYFSIVSQKCDILVIYTASQA